MLRKNKYKTTVTAYMRILFKVQIFKLQAAFQLFFLAKRMKYCRSERNSSQSKFTRYVKFTKGFL